MNFFFEEVDDRHCNILFLGDSLVERADWHILFPEKLVLQFGIGGDTTEGLLNRLDAVIKQKPIHIFVCKME